MLVSWLLEYICFKKSVEFSWVSWHWLEVPAGYSTSVIRIDSGYMCHHSPMYMRRKRNDSNLFHNASTWCMYMFCVAKEVYFFLQILHVNMYIMRCTIYKYTCPVCFNKGTNEHQKLKVWKYGVNLVSCLVYMIGTAVNSGMAIDQVNPSLATTSNRSQIDCVYSKHNSVPFVFTLFPFLPSHCVNVKRLKRYQN